MPRCGDGGGAVSERGFWGGGGRKQLGFCQGDEAGFGGKRCRGAGARSERFWGEKAAQIPSR